MGASWASSVFDRLRYYTEKFDLLEPFGGTLTQLAGLDLLTALLIKRFILGQDDAPALTLNDKEEGDRVLVDPRVGAEVDLLKKLVSITCFDNSALVAQQYGQRKIIRDLFRILFDAANPNSKDRRISPSPIVAHWNH